MVAIAVSTISVGATAAVLFGPGALNMPNAEALVLGGLSATGLALATAAWTLGRHGTAE